MHRMVDVQIQRVMTRFMFSALDDLGMADASWPGVGLLAHTP